MIIITYFITFEQEKYILLFSYPCMYYLVQIPPLSPSYWQCPLCSWLACPRPWWCLPPPWQVTPLLQISDLPPFTFTRQPWFAFLKHLWCCSCIWCPPHTGNPGLVPLSSPSHSPCWNPGWSPHPCMQNPGRVLSPLVLVSLYTRHSIFTDINFNMHTHGVLSRSIW